LLLRRFQLYKLSRDAPIKGLLISGHNAIIRRVVRIFVVLPTASNDNKLDGTRAAFKIIVPTRVRSIGFRRSRYRSILPRLPNHICFRKQKSLTFLRAEYVFSIGRAPTRPEHGRVFSSRANCLDAAVF